MAEELYPHATHIVDICRAREHLHDLAAHLAFITPDPPRGSLTAARNPAPATSTPSSRPPAPSRSLASRPRAGQKARPLPAQRAPDALPALPRPGHVHRLRRHRRRHQGDHDVQRAKQSGMHWTTEGAANIIALRPARQRPVGRAMASQRNRAGRAARGYLTDSKTQTQRLRHEQDHPQQCCRTPLPWWPVDFEAGGMLVALWLSGIVCARPRRSCRPWVSTARTPAESGTWLWSSSPGGGRAAAPRRHRQSGTASSLWRGRPSPGWAEGPPRCSSRRCGTSTGPWPRS